MRSFVVIFLLAGLTLNSAFAAKAKDTKAKAVETKTEAAPAAAPAPAVAAKPVETQIELNMTPKAFDLNMDRVDFAHKGNFGETKAYIIPTVYIRITAKTQTEISSTGSSGASVKAKILVDGLDKKLLQKLALTIAEDLEKKIKAAGFEVIPYDQIAADVKDIPKMSTNEKFGFPTNMLEGKSGEDFAIITPSDDRTFDYGFTGISYKFRDLVKAKKATVIIPEVRFTLTEVTGETSSNSFAATASLNIVPDMNLDWGYVTGLDPDFAGGGISIQRHGKRLASEVAGTVKKVSEDSNSYAGWARSVGDYTFTVEPKAMSEGILRVGFAINDLTVKTIKDAH